MKIFVNYFSLIVILLLSACVTHVEGQRTNGKAIAVMATEDIERIVDSSEQLALYNKPDKELIVWVGQEFKVTVPRRTEGEIWKIEEISNSNVLMPTREENYEQDWTFIFKALEQGKSRIVLSRRAATGNKVIQKEIIDVNVE